MAGKLRGKLTYANVVSTLCLFLLLGGGAYAASTVGGKDVINHSLTGADIKDGSLSGAQFSPDSISGSKLLQRSTPASKLKAHSLTSKELATSSVDSPQIADGAVKLRHLDAIFKTVTVSLPPELPGILSQGNTCCDQCVWRDLPVPGARAGDFAMLAHDPVNGVLFHDWVALKNEVRVDICNGYAYSLPTYGSETFKVLILR